MPNTSQNKKQHVYLDYAATTPVDPAVFAVMLPWLKKQYANPSALYSHAVTARRAVENARQIVSDILATPTDTVCFTSGGTESINMAILGVARQYKKTHQKTGHIITTTIEHHAVLRTIEHLEKEGWNVTYVPVNNHGVVTTKAVVAALQKDTVLVSIMYANNEIGTIEPIAEIGKEILKWRKSQATVYPIFHTDACQATGYLNLHSDKLHVDLMSLNGSKIYGPKGVGILYTRRGIELEPLLFGGGQEMGLRSGTENVPAIIGFAKALQLTVHRQTKESTRMVILRDYFWRELRRAIPDVELNGPEITISKNKHSTDVGALSRLPNNLHVSFLNVEAETVLLYLDAQGISCSTGSACTTDSDEVSHVLVACGVTDAKARSSIRFTLGKYTTKKDINYVLAQLKNTVIELRRVGELERSTSSVNVGVAEQRNARSKRKQA